MQSASLLGKSLGPRTVQRSTSQAPTGTRSSPASQDTLQAQAGHCACGGGCPRCQAASAGLQVSAPGDAYEQEADRVAERVLTMPERSIEAPLPVRPAAIGNRLQRQPDETAPEAEVEPEPVETLQSDFDLRLDWFEMTRPFYTRGAEPLLFFDDRMYGSIGHVWTNNYRFFTNFGLGDSLSADAANFFTPFTIDSALKHDYATASELFERNADISSIVVSPTLFNFDIHDIPGTLRFPFLKIFGVDQPNPYAPPGGNR